MNLFILNTNPVLAAQQYQDLHVNKIVCEGSQMLATAYPLSRLAELDCPRTQKDTPRVHSYLKHPMTMWVNNNLSNFNWALEHILALSDEYTFRSGKVHFSLRFLQWVASNKPSNKPESCITEHPQCFSTYPECIVPGDPVAGYRNYYNKAKAVFNFRGKPVAASWTKRSVPDWFKPAIIINNGTI